MPYLTEQNHQELLAIAEHTTSGHLGAAIVAWSRRNEDPDANDGRHHAGRSATWRTEPDEAAELVADLIL